MIIFKNNVWIIELDANKYFFKCSNDASYRKIKKNEIEKYKDYLIYKNS